MNWSAWCGRSAASCRSEISRGRKSRHVLRHGSITRAGRLLSVERLLFSRRKLSFPPCAKDCRSAFARNVFLSAEDTACLRLGTLHFVAGNTFVLYLGAARHFGTHRMGLEPARRACYLAPAPRSPSGCAFLDQHPSYLPLFA